MNRVTKSTIAYVAVMVIGAALCLLYLPWPPGWPYGVAIVGLLLPGRVQGVLWRDFLRGRHAIDRGRFADAHAHFSRFEANLEGRPWLRHGIYLQWSVYTWSTHAMLANNLGVCELQLGDTGAAQARFEHALALDAGYPVPYVNLAVIAFVRGQPELANDLLGQAVMRGYSGGARDRMIAMAASTLAAIEGRS